MRHIALFFAALAVVFGLSAPKAQALTESEARTFVERVSTEVINLITAPGSANQKEAAMRAILAENGDMRQIAGFAVGRYGREMSEAQKLRYVDLFERYIARAYTARFGEYAGQRITVGQAVDAGRKGVLVKSTVPYNNNVLAVDWQIDDRTGSPKISDIQIEGVSLALSQRDEFTAMLDERGGNINAFLDALQSRITP